MSEKKEKKALLNGWYVLGMIVFLSAAIVYTGIGDKKELEEAVDKVVVRQTIGNNSKAEIVGESYKMPPKEPPKTTRIVRKRVKPEKAETLSMEPQMIKSLFVTTGRGENANWGVKGIFTFVLTYNVVCEAEIVKKETTPLGDVKVVERRTYLSARQNLKLSDIDFKLALKETIPLKSINGLLDVAGSAFSALGYDDVSVMVKGAGEFLTQGIEICDGMSVRGVLGSFGINPSKEIDEKISDFVSNVVQDIFKTDELEGKSYRLTYLQNKKTGNPMTMTATYDDGSELQTEEEWLILRRANVFIDTKIVPQKACSPGDIWEVDTADFECLMDPYIDGTYSGKIKIERGEDDGQGNWNLVVNPGAVSILSDNGRAVGELRLTSGSALVDPRNGHIKVMTVTGSGGIKHLNKHHLLFQSRMEGECDFRAMISTTPIEKK